MTLTNQQTTNLVQMILTVAPDAIDCEECFGRVAEYAQWQLSQQPLPDGLVAIERHLQQCPCCRDEYKALLEALRAIGF